ncbi:hypothetical protein CSB09_00660 [Candidatus Gracilibacteria bacterium]|nr:MAG: hypothetical protein CSB09_00660 [Candidatus Gracilibacteria bacterium]
MNNKEEKIIKVYGNVYAYEMEYLGNREGDGEVVRVICPAFHIDEIMMLEDMPELLETHIETRLEKQEEKKRISLYLYARDILYYKEKAKQSGVSYQKLIRDAVSVH